MTDRSAFKFPGFGGDDRLTPEHQMIDAAVRAGAAAELIALVRPVVFMLLIDRLIMSASIDTIAMLVFVLMIIAGLDAWLNYLKTTRVASASAVTFGDAVFNFWTAFQVTANTDGTEGRPSDAAEIIPRLYGVSTSRCSVIYTCRVEFAACAVAVLVLAWLNLWMTILLLTAIPAVLINEARSRKVRDQVSAELVESASRMRQRVDEMIAGQSSMIQLGASGFATSYIWGALTASIGASVNQQRYQARTLRVGGLIQTLAALTILMVGAGLVTSGLLTVGALIAFDMLAGQLRAKITTIVQVFTTAKDQAATFVRMDEVQGGRRSLASEVLSGNRNRLRCRDISFAYGAGQRVIDAVSFDFDGGKVYAITGASGAGKSTLGKLLAGQLSGAGAVTYELSDSSLRPIVYLPQDAWAFDGSVEDNILLSQPGIAATPDQIEQARRAAKAAGIRNLSTLNAPVGGFGRRLSGGQKQRVHLARALAHPAAVLVADEPSSALDSDLKATVGMTLRGIARSGTVVILISHDEELTAIADEVFAVSEGKLVRIDDILDKKGTRGRGDFDRQESAGV